MSTLTFEMLVDEQDINKIQVGQQVEITADAVEGQTFTGVVDKVNINGTTTSGSTNYPVTVLVDGTPEALKPGMNVSAKIIVEDAGSVLCVPVEAVSRGAQDAVLVDADRDACAAIRRNIESARMQEQCRLLQKDYRAAMEQLGREGRRFDLIFIDPPYKMENTGEMCAALYDGGLLAEAFLIVVEHRRGCAPLLDARFEAFDQRNYGDTQVTFVRRAKADQEEQREDGIVSGQL